MVLSDDELAQITALISNSGDDAVASGADVHWLLYCGVLVFLMQAGFAMLCAGRAARVPHVRIDPHANRRSSRAR